MGAEERAARAQSVAKNVNLGESVTMVDLGTGGTGARQAKKNSRQRKQKESVKNETKLSQSEPVASRK